MVFNSNIGKAPSTPKALTENILVLNTVDLLLD